MTLIELVEARSQTIDDSNQVLFLGLDDAGGFIEQPRSYRDLLENGAALAGTLAKLGVRPNHNFAILMDNRPEFAEAIVAAAMIGAVFVPLEARAGSELLGYVLDYADCAGVVCGSSQLPMLASLVDRCPGLQWIIVCADAEEVTPVEMSGVRVLPYADAVAAPDRVMPATLGADAPMLVMFTSGSTGSPKGVVLSHGEMLGGVRHLTTPLFGKGDKFYTGLSLAHIHGLITLMNSIVLGLPVVISRRFTKSLLWDICRRYRCTVFNALGGMFTEIHGMPARPDDADNPVRIVHSSGMPANLWEPFCQRFGVGLLEGYGSTEGGLLVNVMGEGPVGSIGRPPAYLEAAILDADCNRLGPGEEGEICFRRTDAQPITVNYYKNPVASADKTRGGWLHMGDLGHRDEDGWFFFHHRAGGAIRKDGEFIDPAMIELAISRHPMIADVFVYGMETENDVSGERTVVAAVVPVDPANFSADAILDHCRDVLRRKHVPQIIQVLGAIPKSASQKPIARECIALLKDAFPAG